MQAETGVEGVLALRRGAARTETPEFAASNLHVGCGCGSELEG